MAFTHAGGEPGDDVSPNGPPRLIGGRYRIVAPLGVGGMSVVWRARDEVLGRSVAVKVLAAPYASDAAFRDRIRAEARAAARLTHPHVTTVYDFGEQSTADGLAQPYVVMELVDGVSLWTELNHGALSWRTALEVGAQTAAALSAAHARGLVHRDITPANIMITDVGVKVVDFGISAVVGEHGDGCVIGTPAYLAPERLAGAAAGPAADVYALGVVIYQALTGGLPWPAADGPRASVEREAIPLPAIPGLPEGVAALIDRTLAADPSVRPTSAALSRTLAAAGALPGEQVAGLAEMHRQADPAATQLLQESPQVGRGDGPTGTRVLFTPYSPSLPNFAHPPASYGQTGLDRTDGRAPRGGMAWAAAALLVAVLAAGAVAVWWPGGVATPRAGAGTGTGDGGGGTGPAAQAGSGPCAVRYTVRSEWADGATVDLEITNTGAAEIAGWTLEFDLVGGLTVGGAWNGTWRQDGATVTVEAVNYNRLLEPGRSLSAGPGANLSGRGTKRDHPPRQFRLNGRVCAS